MTVSLSIDASALPTLPLRRQRHLAGRAMLLLAGAVAFGALLPLGFILWIAIDTGWQTAFALIWRPRVGELLVNTLLLELCTLPPTILLAVALAWLTERSDLPGAKTFAWLTVAPLAVPAFVQSYAWVSLFPGFHGLPAAALISVLAYLPFLYLPVAAQMRRLDPALEHAAASLGHSPQRVVLQVVLPQLRLAICGGSLLVGLHLLAEYGLFALIRFDTFTTAIIDQFQSSYNGPAANMLAGVLVLSCLGLIVLEWLLRGTARYARLGSGAPRPAPRHRLGAWRLPSLALPLGFAMLSLGVPVLTLSRWLLTAGGAAWRQPALAQAVTETLGYAALGALIHWRNLPSIVVTLGMSFVWLGLSVLILPVPGGQAPAFLRSLMTLKPAYIPFPIIAAIVIAILANLLLMHTSYGAVLRGAGGNPKAIERAGWSLLKVKMTMFALAGFFGMLAGLSLVGLTTSGDANIALRYTLLSIAGVILGGGEFVGGRISPVGAVIGAVTLTLAGSFLSFMRISPDWQIGAQGAILIIVLAARTLIDRAERRR